MEQMVAWAAVAELARLRQRPGSAATADPGARVMEQMHHYSCARRHRHSRAPPVRQVEGSV
jgi:hypothetical protein